VKKPDKYHCEYRQANCSRTWFGRLCLYF